MKKLLKAVTILTITVQLTSCTTTGTTLTFDDEKTNEIRAHFEDYKNANLDGMLTRWSDDLKVLTNDGTVGLSDVEEIILQHHTLFSEIYFTSPHSDDDPFYAETNTYPDGKTWTKTWYKWHATGNYTGKKVTNLGMIGFRWEDGKIVEENHFGDNAALEAEALERGNAAVEWQKSLEALEK